MRRRITDRGLQGHHPPIDTCMQAFTKPLRPPNLQTRLYQPFAHTSRSFTHLFSHFQNHCLDFVLLPVVLHTMHSHQEPAADIADVGSTTPGTRVKLSTSATVDSARYREMKNDDTHQIGEGRENEKRKFAPLKKARKHAAKQKMMEEARAIEEKRKDPEFAALVQELGAVYRSSSDEEDDEQDNNDDDNEEWDDVCDATKELANELNHALYDGVSDAEDEQEDSDCNDRTDHDQTCPGEGEQSSGNNEVPVRLNQLLWMIRIARLRLGFVDRFCLSLCTSLCVWRHFPSLSRNITLGILDHTRYINHQHNRIACSVHRRHRRTGRNVMHVKNVFQVV
jgi:hypothetical protein